MVRLLVVAITVAGASASAAPTPYHCDGIHIVKRADGPVARRVRLQHELLVLARQMAPGKPRNTVMSLVRFIAPSAEELATLGAPARPALWTFLGFGPIAQRATSTCGTGNSVHAAVAGGLLAYRPVRAGTTRALVAQLVAFDPEGRPHVTPVIAEAELRLGDAVDAPACVVQADDRGVLRAMPLATLHARPPFVVPTRGGLTCRGCHSSPNAMNPRDIAGDELARIDALRTEQVETLANELWQFLER